MAALFPVEIKMENELMEAENRIEFMPRLLRVSPRDGHPWSLGNRYPLGGVPWSSCHQGGVL